MGGSGLQRLNAVGTPRVRKAPLRKRSKNRGRVEYLDAKWRKAVLERDGNQCQLWNRVFRPHCDRYNTNHAHHIEGKKARSDLRHVESNGICLCRAHHDWVHQNPAEGRKLIDLVMVARDRFISSRFL
jgi:predicted restriction endonuclease